MLILNLKGNFLNINLMLGNDEKINVFLINFVIVGITSSVAKSITAPLDRIKLILQNQNSATHIITGKRKKYRSFLDCIIRIPKEQGYISFWRGNGTNVLRYIPSQALNFSFNDLFKEHLKKKNGNIGPIISFAAGALSGASASFAMYPLKFCQTRLSMDMGSIKAKTDLKREFAGLGDCMTKICKQEGLIGIYKGFTVALAAASIYRSLYFGLFDSFKNLYKNKVNYYSEKPPMVIQFLMAQCVTVIAGLCVYPLDTVNRRLMLEYGRDPEHKTFSRPWSAFRVVYINEGFRAFYRGAMTNCLRGLCGALVLVFYDEFLHYTQWKKLLSQSKNKN